MERKFREINIPISSTSVDNPNFNEAINISMQALNAAFFKPNTLFLAIDTQQTDFDRYNELLEDIRKNKYGAIYFIPFATASLAIQKNISLWIDALPEYWEERFDAGINDMAILLSILIAKNWHGQIDVYLSNTIPIDAFQLENFRDMIRLPEDTTIQILEGKIYDALETLRTADLNVFSITDEMKLKQMIDIVQSSRISSIFCLDSGFENAMV